MESSKRKITLKVLLGYITLGILIAIAGWLVFSEIRNFTLAQNEDLGDRNKVIRVGSLIADIYENESLARAALQLDSQEKFNTYISENDTLLKNIDTLSVLVNNAYQRELLDSVKAVFNTKLKTMTELKAIKANNSSEKIIEKAITKLNSIDPILGKLTLEDYVENPESLTPKTKQILEEFIRFSNDLKAKDSISSIGQRQIDSIVTASKTMLKQVQNEASAQKLSLQLKERELIENDLNTSRQLRDLLSNLEREMTLYTENINQKRQKTLKSSISIISITAIISFLLVIMFSLIILNDFWKSQRYRKQLEASNAYTSSLLKSREQLIHMVSHDLRSPLSTILGYSELLQKSHQNAKDDHYINHIRSASAYMTQLVEELLEFSKLEGETIPIELVPFNLNALIEETTTNIKAIYAEKPVKLILKQDQSLERSIISDPFRIKQILHNLIGNAYKFTKKGTIWISTQLLKEGGKSHIKITIKDTGIGISAVKQHDIFNAFTQVEQKKDATNNGFGLGLAITKKLVDLLKGEIRLESEIGKGSTFEILIPIQLSHKKIETEMKVSATSLQLTAIVVDDDASLRQLICDILMQHQIVVHDFEDAQLALEALERLSYDVIFTDIQLPKMNGFHFMEMVKQSALYKGQPIIALTGRTDTSSEHFKESGFSTVIFKPFSADNIISNLKVLFPDSVANQPEPKSITASKSKLFDTHSIAGFLNHDETALKTLLSSFLEDTKHNMNTLKTAVELDDLKTIRDLGHRMLTMFKQLKVTSVIPYLEKLETANSITEVDFSSLENIMNPFYKDLAHYINQDHTP